MRHDGANPSGRESISAVVVRAGEERRHDYGLLDDYE
jgi:hypothetical protein